VAKTVHPLPQPFFVMATQNPMEMEGTYPLPEAQLDRFFFKLQVRYPSREELNEILVRTTTSAQPTVQKVADAKTLLRISQLVREVPIASHVLDYVSRLVLASDPHQPGAPSVTREYVRYGSSPRGAQAIVLAAKIRALLEGRYNVAYEDVRAVAPPALRHRLILNLQAEMEGITPDHVIQELLQKVPED